MAHLGDFSEDALKLFQEAASEKGFDFSEGDVYDFTRCVRKDGSAYGTGGTCRKGSQQDKEKSWSPPIGKKRPPENPTAEQITAMSKDELWDGKASYKPGTAGHQAYKNEIERRRVRDENLKKRGAKSLNGEALTPAAPDPVAGLRKAERDRQAKQGAEEKAKNLKAAKDEMKTIADEIKNRGPHTKEELADLQQKLKYATNRAKQIESGKTMTREQFQAGLKKMAAKQEETARAKSPAVVKEKLSKQEEAMDRLAKEIRSQDGPARYAQIENYKALQKEILESRKRLNYGPGYRPDLGGKYKDPNDINKQYDDIKLD